LTRVISLSAKGVIHPLQPDSVLEYSCFGLQFWKKDRRYPLRYKPFAYQFQHVLLAQRFVVPGVGLYKHDPKDWTPVLARQLHDALILRNPEMKPENQRVCLWLSELPIDPSYYAARGLPDSEPDHEGTFDEKIPRWYDDWYKAELNGVARLLRQ
jgi:hypothetical protein